MTYRDDASARRHRRAAIERELDEVRRALATFDDLETRKRTLEEELESTFREGAAERRKRLPLLSGVAVKSPCKEPWTAMRGDDRVRHCARCDKDVYDLSALTAPEAEALLASREGTLCVRYFQRPDGTVLTSECRPGRRARRLRGFGLAASVGFAAAGAAATFLGAESVEHEVMGMAPLQGELAPEVAPPDATAHDDAD